MMPAPRPLNDIVLDAYQRFHAKRMSRADYDALVAEARAAVQAFPEEDRAELLDDVAMYAPDPSWRD